MASLVQAETCSGSNVTLQPSSCRSEQKIGHGRRKSLALGEDLGFLCCSLEHCLCQEITKILATEVSRAKHPPPQAPLNMHGMLKTLEN
eukprot:871527-Amphidinium_carterae.2